ncbi:DUF2628 domain-containing protein [Methylocapsa sp. D3K7]|uniref:DUF2628 domain-containing protein n=1 Tax=Methylocapsa sp. D3K7 TaxID=3041435 RepID=UPI00244E6D6F|nr:DUF2628 domain-containing protein [Methylocapsa sp. D3K7]WGJ13464.1 DUF2628 domain-containing protein [Methylocapsa sp. D3K7]
MAFYSVHLPGSGPEAAAKAAFVRQSFSWKAFFFGPLWLAWHRLWIALLVWAALFIVLILAAQWLLTANAAALIGSALQLLLGLEAARLREAKLAADGYHLAEIIAVPASDQAEITFYRHFGATEAGLDHTSGTLGIPRP